MNLNSAKKHIAASLVCLLSAICAYSLCDNPKREFRGAWMHTVFQYQYLRQSTADNKRYISRQLDSLRSAGINVVFFQVRPQSDAFYKSDIEPWSRFLTSDGKDPKPFWDPLAFIIDEAHSRGMELHAWLNPYRVTSSRKQIPAKGHLYHKAPKRFITYDGKIYFDPGLPENRDYIEKIVTDIVSRYDVDGIHLDDYFYPYPVAGKSFADSKSFARYGGGRTLGDWRRDNVTSLIRQLNSKIKSLKPWVRFGVSPFGIWRNRKSDKRGSDTDGLENYDSLYADVVLWAENGWVDYLIPQLYWDMEHPKASYSVLLDWWNAICRGRHVYIGQSIPVTMKKEDLSNSEKTQLSTKIARTRKAENILGNCWWPAYSLTANDHGIADSLRQRHQSTPALPPAYQWMSEGIPEPVYDVKIEGNSITWQAEAATASTRDAVRFVVYRFPDENSFDLDNPRYIVAITNAKSIIANNKGYYVVTAIDRVNNESLPSEAVYKP